MMLLLQGLFRLVLSLSLAGGFATLLVMGARVLARDRLGPRWDRYGWMLPLALYLVPVILPRSAPAQQGASVQHVFLHWKDPDNRYRFPQNTA